MDSCNKITLLYSAVTATKCRLSQLRLRLRLNKPRFNFSTISDLEIMGPTFDRLYLSIAVNWPAFLPERDARLSADPPPGTIYDLIAALRGSDLPNESCQSPQKIAYPVGAMHETYKPTGCHLKESFLDFNNFYSDILRTKIRPTWLRLIQTRTRLSLPNTLITREKLPS